VCSTACHDAAFAVAVAGSCIESHGQQHEVRAEETVQADGDRRSLWRAWRRSSSALGDQGVGCRLPESADKSWQQLLRRPGSRRGIFRPCLQVREANADAAGGGVPNSAARWAGR
jgi:hypothetical protein